jgi:hypothetical protein
MTKLSWEKVDEIQAATGKNHYYRTFQTDEGWIAFIHQFDQPGEFVGNPQVYTVSTFEMAQAFAQAFEDYEEKSMSERVARATQVVTGVTTEEGSQE